MPPRSPEAAEGADGAAPGGADAGARPREAAPGGADVGAHPLALAPRPARVLLLGATLLVAVCGFAYELAIIALGTYLLGNSVGQVATVLAAFVSSMGLGSLLAKPLLRRPVEAFAVVEALVALLGGLSALALYAAFAWLDLYGPAVVVVAAGIGLLVGCEIPLLMVLLQRARRLDAGHSVADLLAADYLGAVVAGVAFPLLALPLLGQVDAALAVGALNAGAGLLVLWLCGRPLAGRARAALGGGLLAVLAVLGGAALVAGRFEVSARQALYEDPIVREVRSPYQDIVLTRAGDDLRLFLNGDLQFSSRDEYRYHEALVHPAMAGPHARVLILGGGDGLALREVLRYPGVRRAVEVELDPAMLDLARHDPRLRALNRDALRDPRVRLVTADAFSWLRRQPDRFDVVVADFPDPDDAATAKLYSVELYALARDALAPEGRLVVQAGSPAFAREAFWSVERSVVAAGLRARPYHVDVPAFGDWGFVLASASGSASAAGPPPLRLHPPAPLRSLDAATLRAAADFPPDRRAPPGVQPSTLLHPRIVAYERRAYADW